MKTLVGICWLIVGLLIYRIIRILIKTIKAEIHIDEFIIHLIVTLLLIGCVLLAIYIIS